MIGIGSVRKPYEGVSSFPVRLAGWADETKQKLIETLECRRRGVSYAEEAPERRSGEIPIKTSVETLEG